MGKKAWPWNPTSNVKKEEPMRVLDILRSGYDSDTDDFAWDSIDWDEYYRELDDLKLDKQHALSLVNQYIVSHSVPEKLFAITLAGSIMNPVEEEDRSDAKILIELLSELSTEETRIDYLDAVATALGYAYMSEVKSALLALSKHPEKQVRLSATISLGSVATYNDRAVAKRLHKLKNDPDPEIRDWAMFYLDKSVE